MKGTIFDKLTEWKNSKERKPLVLKGPRQTGKTCSILKLGESDFRETHHLNFQKDKNNCAIFAGSLAAQKILESIEFSIDTHIDRKRDLLFFDEIQDCPNSLLFHLFQ